MLLYHIGDNARMSALELKELIWVAAKPLRGFKGAGVLEVIENHAGDTYRTAYTVRFGEAVYVLHAFQKKSKRGIATPKRDVDLIRDRLEMARRLHESRPGPQKGRRR